MSEKHGITRDNYESRSTRICKIPAQTSLEVSLLLCACVTLQIFFRLYYFTLFAKFKHYCTLFTENILIKIGKKRNQKRKCSVTNIFSFSYGLKQCYISMIFVSWSNHSCTILSFRFSVRSWQAREVTETSYRHHQECIANLKYLLADWLPKEIKHKEFRLIWYKRLCNSSHHFRCFAGSILPHLILQ